MSKYKKKKAKKSYKGIVITFAILLVLVVLVLFVMPQILYRLSPESKEESLEQSEEYTEDIDIEETISSETKESEEQIVYQELAFPVVLEEGKAEVESVFSFSGINPDAGKQNATDVASLVFNNTSDDYLKTATIRAVFSDGAEYNFVVQDLPAGKKVMAFDTANQKLSKSALCIEIYEEMVFEEIPESDSVSVSVEGMMATLQNTSEENLVRIDVYCRDIFDDKYFGGIAYMYTIDQIPARGSTTITASDSMMGVIDVVRIEVNN